MLPRDRFTFRARLLRKRVGVRRSPRGIYSMAWLMSGPSDLLGWPLGGRGRDLVLVELEQVVGGGDQPPFGPAGGSSSSLKAVDPTVELRVSEHRLDHRLAFSVELAAGVGLKHAAHERVGAAAPAGPRALAFA